MIPAPLPWGDWLRAFVFVACIAIAIVGAAVDVALPHPAWAKVRTHDQAVLVDHGPEAIGCARLSLKAPARPRKPT